MKQEIFNESMRTGEFEKMFKDNRIGELLNSGDLSKEQIDLLIQLGKNISKTELEKRQNDLASQPGYEEYILSPMVAKILGTKTKKTKSVPEKTVEKTKKMKEKFDPGNLGKAFKKTSTSSMATKQPKEDTVITEKKPAQPKVGSINAGLYASIASTKISKLRKGDSVSTIATKIYTVFKTDMEERKQKSELARNFGVEKLDNERRRHKELLDAIEKAKKKQPRVPVRDPKTGRYVKTEPIRPGAPSPKPAEVPVGKGPPSQSVPAPKKTEPPAKDKAAKEAKETADKAAKEAADKAAKDKAAKEVETPKPTATKPPAETPATPSTTPVKPITQAAPTTATKITTGAAAVAISASAAASMKGEQSVKNAEDALSSSNKDYVQTKPYRKLSLPAGVPKLGVATPDLSDSTSYGLFGVNNKRSTDKKTGNTIKGSSSIDSFVEMFPELGLPDPGDPSDGAQRDEFDKTWWKVSKENPEKMLRAQLKFFKQKFEDPAIESLKKLPNDISNNPGVRLYMTDRKIQYGETLLQDALKYAKSAKNPKEFIMLMSEFDRTHLRVQDSTGREIGIFRKATNVEYAQIEKGLKARIETRTNLAIGELKKQSDESNGGVDININAPTTVINKQNPKQSISKPTSADKPAIAGIP